MDKRIALVIISVVILLAIIGLVLSLYLVPVVSANVQERNVVNGQLAAGYSQDVSDEDNYGCYGNCGNNYEADYGYDGYEDSYVLPYTNECSVYDEDCFRYPILEQKRVLPCPAPRPVCPLCYKGLEQERGNGYDIGEEQDKINC